MRVLYFLFIILFFTINSATAYELVLPKEKKNYVDTEYAFFVGKANNTEIISINDEKIYIAQNGAFAHSVKLKKGENRIIVKSNFNTQVYKFYKSEPQKKIEQELIEFPAKLYKVKNDNTPLRETPVDFGMNRLSHLFKDTYLLIDGEKDDFYRVRLSKNTIAWIFKNAVSNAEQIPDAQFINIDTKTYKNASLHTIKFTENLPYTINETESEIFFKVYNLLASDDSIYTINIKKPEKYTYNTKLLNGEYTFKISNIPDVEKSSLKGLTIIIDPGHGGLEKGAIGCLGDEEKKINLDIALQLKEQLDLYGAKVLLTRETDGNTSLENRVKLAKDNDANLFISIHLNSIPDIKMNINKHRGTSVYYYNQNSKELAKTLKDKLTAELKTRDDGYKAASFAVLRPTDYIGVLVEVAYMTNPIDSVIYKKQDFSINTANAIKEAILEYFNN